MFGKMWETVTGPWGLAAVVLLAIPGGRKAVKSIAKDAIRTGLTISEEAKNLLAEVKEETRHTMAEVKAERKHSGKQALQKG